MKPDGVPASSSAVPPLRNRWAPPPVPDAEVVRRLTVELKLPASVCSLLATRGHHDPDGAKRFLRPTLDQLHDPALLADGQEAARRVAQAVGRGETIFVHGDYDVDGICAAALYTRLLTAVGGRVVPFVPHRLRDGYDFAAGGLAAAESAGAGLVLTADCGTMARETVARAREAGMDVVVTDHHTVGPGAAEPTVLVNPQRPDCPYPEKGLCGAGVAFKVCELVARELGTPSEDLYALMDLVALATVADLVPLRGENRVLVRQGLRRFAHTRVPGVAALLAAAGVDAHEVNAGKLGFVVAPRINAAGRIGESADALRLLLTANAGEAQSLARRLEELNRLRKEEDARTLDEAVEQLAGFYDPERDYGVVLAGEGWHPGVIGIVASRVVERIHRPTVLVALDGEQGRGSARSVPGFHLYEAILACREHLGRFGGHRQAAGMDVARSDLSAFREAFNAHAREHLTEDDLLPLLRPDLEVALAQTDLDFVHWLGYLGPHGIGNPRPLLLARSVALDRPRTVGDRHLKVTLTQGRDRLDAIGFGLTERFPPASLGPEPYDVLMKVERNEWQGVARAQAQIVDLRPAEGDLA